MRALVTGLILACVLAGSAQACSCARNPTAAGIRQSASAVFTGTALNSRRVAPGEAVTTFKVTESFKGPAAGAIVRVRHPDGPSAACGIRFATGATHTLAAAATKPRHPLSANLCSVWMFLPQVGLGERLIVDLRDLRGRP